MVTSRQATRSDLLAVFSLCWSHHHQNEVLNTLVYCRNTEASKKLTLVEVRGCVSVGNLCEHREFFFFSFFFFDFNFTFIRKCVLLGFYNSMEMF